MDTGWVVRFDLTNSLIVCTEQRHISQPHTDTARKVSRVATHTKSTDYEAVSRYSNSEVVRPAQVERALQRYLCTSMVIQLHRNEGARHCKSWERIC